MFAFHSFLNIIIINVVYHIVFINEWKIIDIFRHLSQRSQFMKFSDLLNQSIVKQMKNKSSQHTRVNAQQQCG